MAILSIMPGLEVNICVDGEPLHEWANNDEEEVEQPTNPEEQDIDWNDIRDYQMSRTVSKFVQCTTGKAFSIQISASHSFKMDCDSIGFDIYVDGHFVLCPILTKSDYASAKRYNLGWTREIEGVEINRNAAERKSTIRRFEFAAVGTTEGEAVMENVKEDAKRLSKVGRIEVRVHKLNLIAPKKYREEASSLEISSVTEVHEKALKGSSKSHGTVLGAAKQKKASEKYGIIKPDPHHPKAIFFFNYRSEKALKTLLIIPRTPSPEPEPEPNITLEDLNEKQRIKVEEFMRNVMNEERSNTIKRENANPGLSGRDKRPRKIDKGKGKVMEDAIDLTGDSD